MLISRTRSLIALLLLAISLAALAWSFLPGSRIVQRQIIQPTEMQLPTPSGYNPMGGSLANQEPIMETICAIHDMGRVVF